MNASRAGSVGAGGLEWMKAGGGVWHDGHPRILNCGLEFGTATGDYKDV
jgi:redox-sensitive bicupin YhaK (pirin superfamily)